MFELSFTFGRAILFGFLPGRAYLKSGLPVRPVDRGGLRPLPADRMNLRLLSRLTDDFAPRDAKPVVTTDGIVETTCIDTPAKDGKPAQLAIPLVNWSGPNSPHSPSLSAVPRA